MGNGKKSKMNITETWKCKGCGTEFSSSVELVKHEPMKCFFLTSLSNINNHD